MSKEKRRVPKLRFPGFTEDWEQRKLSDVLVERNEQQVETREYPLMSFVQGLGVTPKGERYDRSFLVLDQSKKYKRTELGDFIYSSNNLETGSIGINKTGKAVISPVYSIFQGVTIGDSQFIGIMSLLPRFIAKMIRFRQGVVYGQWRIHETDFLDISVLIPSVDERTKITQLILSIEKIITLHQRKLNNIKLKKKALLQKLFPKNGERYPELRFPGFTDAWEQRKLGDIATFSKGNGYSKSDLVPSGSPIILYGRLYTNYETTIKNVDTFVELKDKSVISQGGEVIVPASGETAEDISRASVVENQGIVIGGDLNVIKVKEFLHPTFLALTISNGEQQKELSKRAQGKSVVHLHNSDLQEVNLIFPLLHEQKEISILFEKIDNIITLHQRKLDHLQLQKKALLQQMFV